MTRKLTGVVLSLLLLAACGGSEDSDSSTLPIADPDSASADVDQSGELPDAISLADPDNAGAPLQVTFGGFFYSNGDVIQLCSALAESFPPQCGSVVIDIEAPLDVALEHVAESFPTPEDARINIDQGVYWTDEWVNLSGELAANRLVLD